MDDETREWGVIQLGKIQIALRESARLMEEARQKGFHVTAAKIRFHEGWTNRATGFTTVSRWKVDGGGLSIPVSSKSAL